MGLSTWDVLERHSNEIGNEIALYKKEAEQLNQLASLLPKLEKVQSVKDQQSNFNNNQNKTQMIQKITESVKTYWYYWLAGAIVVGYLAYTMFFKKKTTGRR